MFGNPHPKDHNAYVKKVKEKNDTLRLSRDEAHHDLKDEHQDADKNSLRHLKGKLLAASYRKKGPDLGKLFDEIDKDGSGEIDMQELAFIIKRLIPDISRKQLKFILSHADSDKSGELSRDEFKEFITGAEERKRRFKEKLASRPGTMSLDNKFGPHRDRHECQDTIDLMTEVFKASGNHSHIENLPKKGNATTKFILGEMKTEPAIDLLRKYSWRDFFHKLKDMKHLPHDHVDDENMYQNLRYYDSDEMYEAQNKHNDAAVSRGWVSTDRNYLLDPAEEQKKRHIEREKGRRRPMSASSALRDKSPQQNFSSTPTKLSSSNTRKGSPGRKRPISASTSNLYEEKSDESTGMSASFKRMVFRPVVLLASCSGNLFVLASCGS